MDSKKSSACVGNGDKDHIVLSIEGSESTNLSSCRRGEGMISDEEIPGKKKSVRKKIVSAGLGDESMREREVSATRSEEVGESSKNKKKKKNKSGRTEYEEDDLDKVLAELGITSVSPATKVEKIQVEPADVGDKKDGEEEISESASAKKKKKKKEKEKKAAASVTDKVEEKKVSKHVQKMLETIARRKEAEERKRKEEEEKLRKEEEERLMQEEREREAEEIRQKRKIREKEKRQQLKQEGKLLTEKQKTEAIKREAFRKMVLNDCGSLLVANKVSKRPIYPNKKKLARPKANLSASVEVEDESHADEQGGSHELDLADVQGVSIIESEHIEVRFRATSDNGAEEEDWDAKSLDSVTLNIKDDFDNEEEEPQPMVKKELKEGLTVKPTVKAGVSGKPTKSATKAMLMVDVATQPKDTSKKGQGLVFHEVSDKNEGSLRSPICCIMGHVDTGKTKLLDCIRGTKVQEGEAGGITQQIGATYFPAENVLERTKKLKADAKLKVPGLLVIDTPGHESFTNLRSRGSNLCDLAILVVDIMHGLEPQTIESLNLLRRRNAEFIVALNKVDRLYGWEKRENAPIREAMKQQSKDVVNEFDMRLTEVVTQFKEQGLNTALYYKNREMGETISIVPTSAISGEGIPDLLLLLVKWAEKTMVEKLTYVDKVQCTVLEVKVIEGHGITVDVVLVNGILHEGDQIVVCGTQGPIVTTIRALLTPHPMKELRVKGTYLHHREIKAAQGIKIAAQGLEHAIAGTALHVIGPDEDVEEAKKTAMEDMESVMSRVDKSGEGVYVQASTLGSLEALLEFLKSPDVKIPVSGIGIGPVHKKDIMKAGVMLEKRKEYAMILAFDVKVTAEARELADTIGVKVVCANIIYHLFDEFKAYMEKIKDERKKETASEVVFPCVLRILPDSVFNKRDPIILGVEVTNGILKVGTPICFSKRIGNSRVFVNIGLVASIMKNGTPVDYAKKDESNVTIKIVASNPGEQKMFGRHFDINDKLVSHISSRSIDVLETNYRDELSDGEWSLVVKLKRLFKIQ